MFRKLFQSITQYYGLIIVAHADLKVDENDDEIRYASLAVNKRIKKIIVGLVDLMVYVEGNRATPGQTIAHYKSSAHWEAKSRFPNIKDENILSYENLIGDIYEAIENIATTDEVKQHIQEKPSYSQEEFEKIKSQAMELGNSLVGTKGLNSVTNLINSILGKKLALVDIGDVEALKVLVQEFEDLQNK